MTTLEELRQAIENGHPRDAQFLVSRALEEHIHPSVIVEQAMVPAMKTVGEYYKQNDADIPKILAAARSVRKGFDILEERCGALEDQSIGTVILGTVEGDLHDVGKTWLPSCSAVPASRSLTLELTFGKAVPESGP